MTPGIPENNSHPHNKPSASHQHPLSRAISAILTATTAHIAKAQIHEELGEQSVSPIDTVFTPEVMKSLNRQAGRRANDPGNA